MLKPVVEPDLRDRIYRDEATRQQEQEEAVMASPLLTCALQAERHAHTLWTRAWHVMRGIPSRIWDKPGAKVTAYFDEAAGAYEIAADAWEQIDRLDRAGMLRSSCQQKRPWITVPRLACDPCGGAGRFFSVDGSVCEACRGSGLDQRIEVDATAVLATF
jgi:hypothetical protein